MQLKLCARQCTVRLQAGRLVGRAGTQAAATVGAACGTESDQRARSQHRWMKVLLREQLQVLVQCGCPLTLLVLLRVPLHRRSVARSWLCCAAEGATSASASICTVIHSCHTQGVSLPTRCFCSPGAAHLRFVRSLLALDLLCDERCSC